MLKPFCWLTKLPPVITRDSGEQSRAFIDLWFKQFDRLTPRFVQKLEYGRLAGEVLENYHCLEKFLFV